MSTIMAGRAHRHKEKSVRVVSSLHTLVRARVQNLEIHERFAAISVDIRGSVAFRTYAQFVAGALGGASATYCTHWLDTLKVKMQSFPQLYISATGCLKQSLREEGVRGLYKGATPSIVACTARAAVVFSCYGFCQDFVVKTCNVKKEDFTGLHHGHTGAVTGVLSGIILCPIELLKCRLQAMQELKTVSATATSSASQQSVGPLRMMRNIVHTEGILGMFRGLTTTWAKMIPCSFIYFGSYEQSKAMTRKIQDKEILSPGAVFMCGGVAGICSSIVFPLDVLKTRVQVMSSKTNSVSAYKTLKVVLKQEGLKPLYSGIKPFLLRTCLFSAIQLLVYEQIRNAMLT